MSKELEKCFCGERPDDLHIIHNGQGSKWASATCNKCGEWSIEFRTEYEKLDSPQCTTLANKAWNDSTREA